MSPNDDGLTEAITRMMRDVLKRPGLGPADDFFKCGGDSLRAMQLVSRLVELYFATDSPVAGEVQATLLVAIFDAATPAELAPVLAGALRAVRP